MILAKNRMKRIHVNQHKIRAGDATPITIQHAGGPTYASAVEILGPSKIVFSPDKPLSCGARLWVETRAEVRSS